MVYKLYFPTPCMTEAEERDFALEFIPDEDCHLFQDNHAIFVPDEYDYNDEYYGSIGTAFNC